MAGHNKWSKIKHKKAVVDAKRSKEFSKLSNFLTMEAKKAQGNMDSPGLRLAIEKARKANMPNDNIEKAINKASDRDAQSFEEVTYEIYGPGGVAIIAEALTDNNNRTVNEVKSLLSKKGLELAQPGSALWAFEKTEEGWSPKIFVEMGDEDKNQVEGIIETLSDHDDIQDVYTNLADR